VPECRFGGYPGGHSSQAQAHTRRAVLEGAAVLIRFGLPSMTDTEHRQTVGAGDILAEKYRVERVLGQGGMGVVVLAEHMELRERVAIKFLLDEASQSPELSERFLREARAAVRIKSEHVVRIIDVGRLPSDAPYMVMEYLEGQDLSQRLLTGPVPIEDAVDYVIQCCEAMQVAHRAGIVHRDLKPANLFLTQRPDGSQLIKVLDFGISKIKSTDAAQLRLTQTQAMMGSPLYMSPEQMRSSRDVSASADIWSLGVILHELITGDVPFIGSTFPEVLVQVMSAEPARLGTLRAGVPDGLEAVVLRCLEKDPGERFSSVAALGVALSPFGSPRTLGLQARLQSSLSQQPPALVLPRKTLAFALAGEASAAAPLVVAAAHDVRPSKTNTAWGGQSGDAVRGTASRRRRQLAIAAGVLGVVCLGTALFFSAGPSDVSPPPRPAAASAPLANPSAAPTPSAPSPAAIEPRVSTPKIAPALDVPAAASAPASEVSSETRASEAPKAVAAGAASGAARTRAPATPRTSAHPGVSARVGATARVGAATSKPARAAANEPAAPAVPPRATSPKVRSKPLSIEFK
jgi:eukaryotic-like serine/threonine-protein kinase